MRNPGVIVKEFVLDASVRIVLPFVAYNLLPCDSPKKRGVELDWASAEWCGSVACAVQKQNSGK